MDGVAASTVLPYTPSGRRQGIASALVRAGEERLQASGAKRLTAIVANGEYAAAALWDVAGYHRQNRDEPVRPDGG